MQYNMTLKNSNGKIYAAPDLPFMSLAERRVVTVGKGDVNGYNTGVPASRKFLLYVKSENPIIIRNQYDRGGIWHLDFFVFDGPAIVAPLKSSDQYIFYIFTDEIPPSAGGWGVEMYNKNGARVFSSSVIPLQNRQVTFPKDFWYNHLEKKGTEVDVGCRAAVMPVVFGDLGIPFRQQQFLAVCFLSPVPKKDSNFITLGVNQYHHVDFWHSGRLGSGRSYNTTVNYINTAFYD